MIRKFAPVPGFRVALIRVTLIRVALILISASILTGITTVQAQQTPPEQTPAQQAPVQQAPPEETVPGRKPKIKDFKKWTINLGGGANLTNGTTRTFVRGGGGVVAAGVARNYSKYFGLRADFQWDNLPLRSSALQLAQAPSATSHVYSFMLGPIINVPVTKKWGGFIVAGASFYHRSGKLDSSTVIPGSACNAFFTWWGTCFNASIPLNKQFLTASQNQFGENFGGGVTRKIRPNMDLYVEFRYLHGKRNGITTDLRP